MVVQQTYRAKNFKFDKLTRGEARGVDSWRYVNHVAKPLLWPECKRQLTKNQNFLLMEDNAPAHDSVYTNRLREAEGIQKVKWPPNSPDFNPIEHIWHLMKKRILTRRGSERKTTSTDMKRVLKEE